MHPHFWGSGYTWEGFTVNDEQILIPALTAPPAPGKRDLDDLIFQGEGWLASDR